MRVKYDQRKAQPPVHIQQEEKLEGVPEGVPEHFFNEDGEIDLRQVSGKEALKYFAAMGIAIPEIRK